MNFNALKIILVHSTYMQDKREIPAIYNEKIVDKVLKFSHTEWGVPHL